MRIVFLHVFLLVSINLNAQASFYKQIKSIVADSASGFLNFRAQPKFEKGDGDSTFFSTIQIEGTTKNEIYKLDTLGWVYNAIVSDSVKLSKAERICDEWKERMEGLLGGRFVVKKYKVVDYLPSKYGWNFLGKGLSVSIWVMPLPNDGKLNRVFLEFGN